MVRWWWWCADGGGHAVSPLVTCTGRNLCAPLHQFLVVVLPPRQHVCMQAAAAAEDTPPEWAVLCAWCAGVAALLAWGKGVGCMCAPCVRQGEVVWAVATV